MKTLEMAEATATLTEYAQGLKREPVILTERQKGSALENGHYHPRPRRYFCFRADPVNASGDPDDLPIPFILGYADFQETIRVPVVNQLPHDQ